MCSVVWMHWKTAVSAECCRRHGNRCHAAASGFSLLLSSSFVISTRMPSSFIEISKNCDQCTQDDRNPDKADLYVRQRLLCLDGICHITAVLQEFADDETGQPHAAFYKESLKCRNQPRQQAGRQIPSRKDQKVSCHIQRHADKHQAFPAVFFLQRRKCQQHGKSRENAEHSYQGQPLCPAQIVLKIVDHSRTPHHIERKAEQIQ